LKVEKNTLIQAGDGWIFLICAVVILYYSYQSFQNNVKNWAVVIVGVLAFAATVYEGTGEHLKLHSTGEVFGRAIEEKADPGIGIYAAGAGGLIAIIGGAWIMGFGIEEKGGRRLKRCPECAEHILADAVVCKHCSYRFDSVLST
jgi:hypothetical protein